MQNKPRNVVLCLMEVSRLASRFGLEPPGLVQMEKEIDAEEARVQNDGSNTKISTPNIRHRFVFILLVCIGVPRRGQNKSLALPLEFLICLLKHYL